MSRGFVILLLAVVSACSKTTSPSAGSQTHFLTSCESSCPAPYDCTCGVCTQACTRDETCEALAGGAQCLAPEAECGEASTCDVECQRDADCASLSAMHTCSDGRCRVTQVEPDNCAGMGGASCTPLALRLDLGPEIDVCDWGLPDSAPDTEELCSATIVFSETGGSRSSTTTRMVASADACAGSAGWYVAGTATDRRVVLCPNACVNATGIAAGDAVLTLACATGGTPRPSSCELEDIRPLLSTRESSRPCGTLPIAASSDEVSAALDCVRISVADGATFDVSWARQGTDSTLRSGLVGVHEQDALVVYSLSYDSITFTGTPGLGETAVQSTWTPCASFMVSDTCTGNPDSCFTCDSLPAQVCGCIPSSAADELPQVECASADTDVTAQQLGGAWVFTYATPPQGYATALLAGQAVVTDGCLLVNSTAVVWNETQLPAIQQVIDAVASGATPTVTVGGGGLSIAEGATLDDFPPAIVSRCSPTVVWFASPEEIKVEGL